jgi:hypothetical protein
MADREVVQTTETVDRGVERDVVTDRGAATAPGSVVAARVVWYIAGVIISLLALRLILQLLGANEGNPFVDLVYGLSGIFAAPFFGMFSYEPSYGVSYFEISTLVAILIYALLGWGLARLFTLGSQRSSVA